ncbi:MAG: hypothetical protein ACFFAO_02975, partial [Candidatus Hermodarchaeota archaeon]
KLYFFREKAAILPQISKIELQNIMESGLETFMTIEQEEKSFVANILKNCIKNGQIKECDVEKMSEFMFALVEGIKNNYSGFTNNKVTSSTEYKNMIKDVQTALKIFMDGLK